MASEKQYLDFILDQLDGLEGISFRPMMGEFILYYRKKIFGGIYDNRLLVKPVKAAVQYMPEAEYDLPYEGGSKMLRVDNVDDSSFLQKLIIAMYDELPAPRKRKKSH